MCCKIRSKERFSGAFPKSYQLMQDIVQIYMFNGLSTFQLYGLGILHRSCRKHWFDEAQHEKIRLWFQPFREVVQIMQPKYYKLKIDLSFKNTKL